MKRLIRLFLLLVWTAQPALAEPVPVKVTADTFEITQNDRQATFTGSVVVTRGAMTLTADEVTVFYGMDGEADIDRMEAVGNVRVDSDGQKARGDRAEFDPATQVIRLSGNVTVTNAQGTMNGPELLIDLSGKSSTFTSGKGGRVSGVFTPK